MEADGVAADGHTAALEIAVHGNAGRLDAAEAALDRAVARGDADAVVHNAHVGAAAKVADAEAALAALRRHPAPDITSYNSRSRRSRRTRRAAAATAVETPASTASISRRVSRPRSRSAASRRTTRRDDAPRHLRRLADWRGPRRRRRRRRVGRGGGGGAGVGGGAVAGAELETDLRGLTRPAASTPCCARARAAAPVCPRRRGRRRPAAEGSAAAAEAAAVGRSSRSQRARSR